MIRLDEVNCGKQFLSVERMGEVCNMENRIIIWRRSGVQGSVLAARSPFSILLGHEVERRFPVAGGATNDAFLFHDLECCLRCGIFIRS